MKGILRRVFVFVVVALVCAIPFAAFADSTPSTYSITVENKNENVTIDKFWCFAYKIADVETSLIPVNEGDPETTYGYTLSEPFLSFSYKGYTGAELIEYLAVRNSDMDATEAEDLAQGLLKYVETTKIEGVPKGKIEVADGVERATISGLTPGYYLITVNPTENPTESKAVATSLTILPNEVTGGVVEPKFETPKVSKKIVRETESAGQDVSMSAVEVGSTVQFKIESRVPVMAATYENSGYEFSIIDTWTEGVAPIMTKPTEDNLSTIENLSVTIGDDVFTPVVVNDDEGNSTNAPCTIKFDEKKFILTFEGKSFWSKYHTKAGTPIVISYQAEITSAILDNNSQAKNLVELKYPDAPQEFPPDPDKEVTVYTFTIDVWKYAQKSGYDDVEIHGLNLPGAEFVLYKKAAKSSDEPDELVPWYYSFDGGQVVWVKDKPATGVVTKENGGLEYPFKGLTEGTYYLEEIKAPAGYNLLTIHPEIALSISEDADATIESKDLIHVEQIENHKGIQLPGTGGIGTIIFYCVGGVLVIGALVVLIARRRMASRDK